MDTQGEQRWPRRQWLLGVMAAAALLCAVALSGPAPAAAQPKLSQVVYISLSKACGCMKEKCQAGDLVVDKAFAGEKQALLKRIDYSTQKEAAREYLKKYRLSIPPSLLFLDAQGEVLWRADGDLDYDTVMAKLKEFGT